MVERDLVVGPISNVNMYVFFFLLIALHHMSVSFVEDKLEHYIKRVLFVFNWCMMAYTTPLGVQWSTGFVEREKNGSTKFRCYHSLTQEKKYIEIFFEIPMASLIARISVLTTR